MIFMPKPKWALVAIAWAIRPKPIQPNVLPVTLVAIMWVGRQPDHSPLRR